MKCKCCKIKLPYPNALPLPLDPFYKKDYNHYRRLKIIYFSHKLRNYSFFKDLDEKEQFKIITKIEKSCLNESLRKSDSYSIQFSWENTIFTNLYHSICYNIFSCLESEDLVKKIVSGEFDTEHIGKMSHREMEPEKYEDLNNEISKRINTEESVKYTEMHYCKKCKHNKTTVKRIQARSNDEGSTLSITCLFCNNSWFK